MSIRTFTSKFATRIATLTIIVGSMMSVDSHAQVANTPVNSAFASAVPKNASTDVSPEARATVMTTLRQSTNSISFEKNAGQYGSKDVLYGFRTHFGSMGVYNNKLRLVSRQEDPNQDRDVTKPAPVQIVDITFPGANASWTVEPGPKSSVKGAYFDENGKATRPDIYNEVTLKNVYPGVDLRLYSGKAGTMEFDWLVAKASDYDKIKLHMIGQDALTIGGDGNLTIKLREEDMKMAIPETYQVIGSSKKSVKASMLKADDNTICYKVNGDIDPNQPLVIDPVMVWATFMVGGDAQFDEYLYAVATTPAGNVYCGGVTNQPLQVSYMSGINAAPGFNTYTGNTINGGSSAGAGSSEAVIYEFNASGTAIVAWAYTTVLVPYNGGQQGPPESTQSLPLVPTSMGIFPNGRVIMVYSEDLIQVWSSDLTSVSSSSASPASPLTNAQYNSVVVVDDSTFYLSGITTTAYPSDIYPLAPDAAFGGSEEAIILRETHANTSPFAPVCAWGTYVGGNGNENFATIAISYDHTKLAFAVHSVVPSGTLGYPTLVNAVDNSPGAAATTEILIGSFAVSATPQTAFTMFSYLGGSGDEGVTVETVPDNGGTGTISTDRVLVCADNNYFYVAGNTYSSDFPGVTASSAQSSLSSQSTRNADQFISRIPWNGSAGTGFAATYNGGTSTDIVGGLAVDFRSSNVVLFGTTGSTNFPTLQSTPNSPWYQSTFTAGASWSMCYGSFSNDMTTRTYGTYIGGSHNNYLGSTGTLRGSGQLYYNLATGLINIGTTCHSYGPTFNPQWFAHAAFDTFGLNLNNDTHFIFEWDPNTFDYGDAPSSYEQGSAARSALSDKIQLGVMIDAEASSLSAAVSPYASSNALGDDTHALPDEDGVSKPLPPISIGATTYSVLVDTLLNNTGGAITLAGWIDANFNGKFDASEYVSKSIPTSANNQLNTTLNFTGLPAVTYPDSGVTFLRLRLTNGPVTANSDTGELQAGEVEDYAVCVKPNAGPDQSICLLGTATMAATNTIGTWTKLSTNPGTCTITSPNSPTTTITSFSTTGTYNFIWTNPGGCSDTAAVIVTAQPGTLTISPNTVNLCTGGSVILTASVSPSGGTYQWTPTTSMLPVAGNTASVTVDPSSTQTYSVLYSIGGCTTNGSRIVTVFPTALTSNAGPNQTYCSNVGTTISIGGAPTASGGSGHYTYQWSPATRLSSTTVSNPTITSIVAGTVKYYVTVTDSATLCTSVDSMTLTINPSVSVSIAISDTNLCLGQSTPLSATGLGTPSGGTYQWSPTVGMTPANGTASSVTVSPSSNQTYIVTYSLNGCTSSASRTVNVYPNLTAHAGGNQSFCLPVSGTVTLGANPAVTGGSGSFTYAWSPATNLSSTSVANPTITNKPAGSIKYYLTVTDSKSLCSSVDSAIITFDSTATVTISSPDTSLCNGQTSVLSAIGSPLGGSYQWSPTNFMTPIAGNTATVSVDPGSNQTYQVTYTANGCSGTASKTVDVVPAVVAHAGGPQTFCMPVTGTITLGNSPTASGGSGSFNYLWTPSTNLSSSSVSNPTITTVVPGVTTYKVLVTDRVSGCTSVDSMVLTINRADTANAGVSTPTCFGTSVILGGSPTGKGGTGTLTYTWSPGTGLTSTSIANPTASPASNTTYDLTVSDTKGCSATSTITITVNPVPSASAGPNQALVGCSASSVTIGGSPTGSGGTGALTYNWSPVGGLDSTNVPNPTVSHLGSKATYTVTVTDANSCTATSSVQVNVTSSTLQVDAGVGGSYCSGSGGSVTLTGNVTGGTGPYVYVWSPSANLSDTNAISTIANPSAAGSYLYTLNVTDTNGCNASDTVRINVWPAVVASAGPNVPVCMGSSVAIGGNPTASLGSGSYTYSWAPGGGLDSTTVSNPVASPTLNTTYTVTVTDSKSCSATSSALVTVNSLPVANAGTNQSYCIPVTNTITLGATPSATGGSGTYKYRWTPSTGLSDSTAGNPTVSTLTASNVEYHLLVTDAITGCTSVDSVNLTILSQPTVTVSSLDTNLCTSESAILTAIGSPAGGTYQWAPLSNMNPAAGNTATVTVSPTSNQTYQVIYTQNTCRDTSYKAVNVYPTVTANAGPDQTFCSPVTGTVTIGGNPSATGGSGKYSYLWSPITNLSSTIVANPTLTGTSVGTTVYKLTVTDSVTGCTSVDSMILIINPTVTVSISPTDTNLCAGQSTTLAAVGSPAGGSYQWSPTFNMNPGAGNASSVTVEPSGTQTYQVTYVANGCASGAVPITVHVYPGVVADAGPDLAYCLPYSGTILLGNVPSASGGSGSYTYSWSPGFNLNSTSTPNPVVTKAVVDTEYILIVTDNVTGCIARDSMHLSINNYPTVSISAPDTNLCFGQSTVLTGVPSPAGGTFSWAPTVYIFPGTGNTQSITVRPSANQIYQLIYDLSGCPDTVYQNVYVYPDVVANAGGNQTFCLPISGTVTLGATHTATGGSGTYTYLWSPSTNLSSDTVANPTIDSNVATNTTYYVTVTDAVTGCTAVDSMVLILSSKTTVTINAPQTTICLGSSATLTAVGSPAGGTYQWEPIVAITPANGSSATVQVSPASGMQTYFVYYDLSGCSDTASVQITTYPQVVADAGLYQVYCLPIRTATIGAPAAGGSGNFSYKWSPGINLSDSTIEMPTVDSIYTPGRYVYTLTVTDNVTGCTSVDSTILTLLPEPHISVSVPDSNLCLGQSAIMIALGTPSGGTYQWGPFGTLTPVAANTDTITATPTGTGANHYYVIYNSNEFYYEEDFGINIQANIPGCIDTAYTTLHVYPPPVANAGPDESYCLPLSGPVTVGGHPAATGGSGHYSYLWTNSGGDSLANDSVANPILANITQFGPVTLTLTVTDSLTGCTSVDSMVLTINPKPTVSIATADTNLCAGQSTILVATGGPTAGGTYQWSPTVGMTPAAGNAASVTVSPPSTQTYYVVYSLNGCSNDTAYKTVVVYPGVVAHAGGARSYCSPTDTVTLGANPAATGGSGNYSYTWAPAGTLNNAHIPNPVATPTGTTTYYLTVTDLVTGCSSVDSTVVTHNPGPHIGLGANAQICVGSSVFLNASGGITYAWSPGATLSNPSSCCPLAKPDSTTIYVVTVTDNNGCTASASDTVTVSNTLVVTIAPVSICAGGSANIVPSLIGPNYKYLWTPGTGLNCVTCASPVASPASTTIYTLQITDTITGCSGTDTVKVTVHPLPQADFFGQQLCQGDTVQFTDESTSVDPIVSWFYNFGDSTLTTDTSSLENPRYAYITYSAHNASQIVTTIYGCTDTFHLPVYSLPPVFANAGSTDSIPLGGSVVLGATGGTHFAWSPSAGLSPTTISDPTASPDTTTTYTVTVTNDFGCSATASVTVVVLPLPNVSAGRDTFVCLGYSVPLLGSSTTPGVTYQWTPAFYLDSPNVAQPIATPIAAGQYQYILTVTQIIGTTHVSNSDTMILTVNPAPVITAIPDSQNVCSGAPINISFNSSLGSTTYKWTASNGTSGTGNVSTVISNATLNDSLVIFTVVGTTPSGCTDTIHVPVIVQPLPIISQTAYPLAICGGTYFVDTALSNSPGTTFTWTSTLGQNGTGADIDVLINNPGVLPLTDIITITGTYNGCASAVLKDTFRINPLPHANAGMNQVIVSCSQDSVQLGGIPTAFDGTPGYTYLWSPAVGGLNPTVSNPFVKNIGATTIYTVVVTDTNGCVDSSNVKITVAPPTLAVNISENGSLIWCAGSGASVDFTVNTSGGVPLYAYSWTPTTFLTDSTSQVTTANPNVAGTYIYTVVVTDGHGCQASGSATITVKSEPHPVITGLDTIYCANVASVPLTASIPGGTWSGPGVIGNVFRPSFIGAGTYTIYYSVTVAGCTNDTFENVTVAPLPVTSISGNNPSYCTMDPATNLTGSPSGGTWSGPGINDSTGVFTPDSVNVPNNVSRVVTIWYHYTSAGGCTDSSSISVTVNKSPNITITASADTICQSQTVILTPHYPAFPSFTTIQWYNLNGTLITNSLNPITVSPTLTNYGYYTSVTTVQGCTTNDTIYISVNPSPVAENDYDTVCGVTTILANVLANDSTKGNTEVLQIVSGAHHGTATVDSNEIEYTPVYGYYGNDSVVYRICNQQCTNDCDTAKLYLSVCPMNLPPTADTIRYTQLDSVPQDVNVISATGAPNGLPLVISMVGDSSHGDSLVVVKTGNGAYTITGLDTGLYVIVYQVCDSGQYPPAILCDTSVIIAHITPPADTLTPQGPVANNDFATTQGTLPAVVNVRANDYTNPTSHGLTIPTIIHIDTTSDGTWSVNAAGDVIFQPNPGLAPGIYHDTAYYKVCDLVNGLCASAYVVVTTDEINTPIPNRPPVAVDDHETVPENTTGTFNIKTNDSDPDGNPLTIPVVVAGSGPSNGTIVSIGDNGTVVYTPRPGVYSNYGVPADSFEYYICDSSASYPTGSLCDSAEVYIYVTPRNEGPTADTIRYTQLDSVPQDVNVISATGSPNGAPLVISLVGDSSHGDSLVVVKTGNGAYTITGLDTGTYLIVYQVCDSAQSPPAILCDTSVIIAHIVPPADTLTPQGPIANNDFATTYGTLPAVVNVRANDYSNPTSHGLTIPTIISMDTTNGTWSVDGFGNVIFQPNPGLAPGTYHDTAYYKVCDLVNGLCATAYVVVTTVEGVPIPNRPPVAVDDHETVPENTTGTFNIKTNDSDPDGNPLTIPVVVAGSGPSEGTIVSIGDNGTIVYIPDSNFHGSYTQPADSFRYYICDSSSTYPVGSLCDSAEVYIYVTPVNLPPVANNLYVTTPENNPLGVDVATGAFDPNGDPLTYSYPNGTTTTDGGSIVVTSNGAVNYYPPTGFVGTDSFEYKVCDSSPYVVHSLCDSAWVIVEVTPPGDTIPGPPVAVDDYVTTDPGSTITVNVKANDYDSSGFPITVTAVSAASLPGTTVSINPDNTVNVTVPDSISGNIVVDTFNYTLCDTAHSLCASATVYVTINEVDTNIININRPPVAVDYFSTICADQISTVDLLSRDMDPNGDPLHVAAIVVNPTHGVATISGVNVVYIPDSTAGGKDSLEYRVCDDRTPELCATAWVYYTINAVNTRTLAVEDTAVTMMNTSVNIDVVRNDIVPDTTYTAITTTTPPTHGSLVFASNSFTYIPDPGFAGYDTFYYRVCNLRIPGITYCDSFVSTCDVGLVSIFVAHHPPHIDSMYVTIPENTPLDTICPTITDPDGNFVKIVGFACGPQHGTAGLTNTGSDSCLTYTPTHDFSGHDTLCVVVCDTVTGNHLCDTAKVYITVTPVCQPPVANVDSYTVNYNGGTVGLHVLVNDHNYDTSALTLSLVTTPNCGTALVFANSQINYSPTGTSNCSDSFKYSICNVGPACTLCDTTTVYVTVKGGTFLPPIAVNDTVTTPENIPICVHVTANDHQGTNPFQITSACTAHHGTDSIASNGYICYTPELGYIGPDSFCYTICDNSVPALCSTAEVYVTVTPNGFPPIAVNDTTCGFTNTPVVICVLDNDYDTSGSLAPNTLTLLTSPANGIVTGVNAFGCITFVPNGVSGVDSFRYRICDSTPVAFGGPLCATASVYVTVTPAALPPVVTHTSDTILEGDSAIVCPTITDADSGIVSITSVCTPLHGTASLIGTTCVGYTPDPLFFGSDSFCIVVCDQGPASPCYSKLANAACDTTIVHITVTHVPHCPIANMDYASGHDGVPVVIDELANDYYVHPVGAGVSVTIVSGPAAGNTASVNANGTITYTAGASYNGVDTIVYQLTDSIEGCDSTARIIIYTVTTCVGPNLFPELDSVCEGSVLTSTVLMNQFIGNTGLGSFSLVSGGAHGITYIDTLNNTIVYDPNSGYFGMDTILYEVCDRCSPTPNCAQGTLVVDVQYINHTPTAVDDTLSLYENTMDTINVLANDHTVDSVPLTVSLTAQPVHGTLTVWNNELIYTPDQYYCGVDSFGYLITEPSGSANCTNDRPWDIGLVFVDVFCVNQPPYIPDTTIHIPEDTTPVTICIPFVEHQAGQTDSIYSICPASHGTVISATISNTADDVCVTYQADSNFIGTDSICVVICNDGTPVLCDTSHITIDVFPILFAVNDTGTTGCHEPVTICVKNNDYGVDGHDSFVVKGIVVQPAHGTATIDSVTECVLYTPDGTAASYPGGLVDSFEYFDQDLAGATASAWVHVRVICCTIDAISDSFTVGTGDTIYANVLANDLISDSFALTLSIDTSFNGPHNGTIMVVGDSIRYISTNLAYCGIDSFEYIISNACGMDTGLVQIHVNCDTSCHKPIAVNDSVAHGYVCNDTINVLANDTFAVGATVTVISGPLYGTTAIYNNEIVYIPDGTHPSTLDSLRYSLCNLCGKCDTATLKIWLTQYPCNLGPPVVLNDTLTICRDNDTLLNVLLGAYAPDSETVTLDTFSQGTNGHVTRENNTDSASYLVYTPNTGFSGVDFFTYRACDNGVPVLCNVGTVVINVNRCGPPPIVVDSIQYDTTTACTGKTFCIDSIYQGAGYQVYFEGICDSPSHGIVMLDTNIVTGVYGTLCYTYTPGGVPGFPDSCYVGNDSFCVVICDPGPGNDTSCATVHIIVTIQPKVRDSIWANPYISYTCNAPDTLHVLTVDGFIPDPGTTQTGKFIYITEVGDSAGRAPLHGSVSIGGGDTTIIYIPDSGYVGLDTFWYVITNGGTPALYDTTYVLMYVCTPPTPIAVNDNNGCMDTTGYVDQSNIVINILANDTLVPGIDTMIVIIDSVQHGRLTINANYTVTYTPDSGFRGNDYFTYVDIETVPGATGRSDTATVCINIVDTVEVCFFPNGISPNGDGVNDVFAFPCNDKYPNATLRIFNRWGDAIWQSKGAYENDWGGTNMDGKAVPDGTYYFVYTYNDGSGRSTARFIVVHR